MSDRERLVRLASEVGQMIDNMEPEHRSYFIDYCNFGMIEEIIREVSEEESGVRTRFGEPHLLEACR